MEICAGSYLITYSIGMEPQGISETDKYKLRLLESLEATEAFRIWRTEVADPVLLQLEGILKGSDALAEAELRGSLKHYFSVKGMFYEIFDNVRTQNDQIRQEENALNIQDNA